MAFKQKRDGVWHETTWRQYHDQVRAFAKALLAVGFEQHASVAILGFNGPEWFVADMGAIFAGGKAAGIYATNGPAACAYIVNHARAQVVVVEDERAASKILSVRAELECVKRIVQWSGVPADGVVSWADFVSSGAGVPDGELDARIAAIQAGHCATLIYTSGTTGNPKAVMATHDSLIWTARQTQAMIYDANVPQEHMISFLPLSHIAAQMLDLVGPLASGATVWFAQPDALKGSLGETMKEVRPTIFLGVPRVWEKIQTKIQSVMAMKMAEAAAAGVAPQPLPAGALAAMLGLDRCHYAATSAAPIALSTLQFFAKFGLTVHEIYGMSECTGPQTFNYPGHVRLGSVGKSFPGTELRLEDCDAEGNGEIVYRGRHIMSGYLNDSANSAATITQGGWLHSGDVGKLDADGFLFITGRKKELLITAGGENVPPVYIETAIKDLCPFLANVVCIGDRRQFLAALVSLRQDMDLNTGAPIDELAPEAKAMLARVGCTATKVSAAQADPAVKAAIDAAIAAYNGTKAISQAQQVRKWAFLPNDLSLAGGELTPTQKLMRRVVTQKYAAIIEELYAGDA